MYAILTEGGREENKGIGIKSCARASGLKPCLRLLVITQYDEIALRIVKIRYSNCRSKLVLRITILVSMEYIIIQSRPHQRLIQPKYTIKE